MHYQLYLLKILKEVYWVNLESDGINWIAEFLPWGSDGRLQSRVANSHSEMISQWEVIHGIVQTYYFT